jgi:hypothetical protein
MTRSGSSSQEAEIYQTRSQDQARSNWQLQDAKARFSEAPQHVIVRGEPAVVVVSEEDFAKLTSSRPSIVDHILEGARWPDDLVEAIDTRSRDPGRRVEL